MGRDDHALIEDDEFDGEETPRLRKGQGGWATAVHGLYFDEEREREREFLDSLRYVPSIPALLVPLCVR